MTLSNSEYPLASRHKLTVFALWVLAALIATFLAAIQADSAIFGDTYIPRTNDSFYHARRILDAAVGPAGLIQHESRINPPDGMLVPWPWGYDYLMAKMTQFALFLRPEMNPMSFLAWVPVAWTSINAALFLGATGAAGLSTPMRALAMLGFALSPLVQLLHSVAMLDHHFIELTFVLATAWTGMAWMKAGDNLRHSILFGLLLGIAPAFHVGLFLLQLIPLACLSILWLRRNAPPHRALIAFGLTLAISTLLILLPSLPFRQGVFDYTYLSWFHLYVSSSTAIFVALIGLAPYSQRRLAILGLAGTVLAIPMLTNLLHGAVFLSASVSILPDITETLSPFRFNGGDSIRTSFGIGYHSWLLLTVPFLILWFGFRVFRETEPHRLYFSLAAVLGLVMLSLQFRFHYYGLFALVAGLLLIVEDLQKRFSWQPGLVFVAALGGMYLAYQPPLRDRLFEIYAMAADPMYQGSIPIHLELEQACAEDPGLILANHDDGNSLLYHTECSVIANNFILGTAEDDKFAKIDSLMRSSPQELLRAEPQIKYLFVRANDFGFRVDGRMQLESGSEIVSELLLSNSLPEGFERLRTAYTVTHPQAEPDPHAWLFKLSRE